MQANEVRRSAEHSLLSYHTGLPSLQHQPHSVDQVQMQRRVGVEFARGGSVEIGRPALSRKAGDDGLRMILFAKMSIAGNLIHRLPGKIVADKTRQRLAVAPLVEGDDRVILLDPRQGVWGQLS